MHILHVIDSLAIGGAERMLVDIANASAEQGHRISVCVTRSRTDLAPELSAEINLLTLNRHRRFELTPMRKFAGRISDENVTVLHVHGRSSFAFCALAKSMRMFSRPIILHDHFGIELNSAVPMWFLLIGKKYVDAYVGVYEKLAVWAASAGIPQDKISVIGNALDLTRFRPQSNNALRDQLDIPTETIVGLVICGIREEKGIDLLINAVALIKDPKPFLIVVAGGVRDAHYMQSCKSEIEALGLEDKIVFLGEYNDAWSLAFEADFAIMPSRSESGPLVLIEFMAAGLPFAAFKVGDISQKSALLGVPGFVPPQDVVALSEEIRALIEMPKADRKSRGNLGQTIAREHFDIRAKLQEWISLYNRVSGHTRL